MASAFWRRLDSPGHDFCLLSARHLRGTAVFKENDTPAFARYEVTCDDAWRAVRGVIRGQLGERAIDVTFARDATRWTMNGVTMPDVDGCVDLDFGFTPATNIFQLNRIALPIGARAEFDVAWFDLSSDALTRLPQIYERRDEWRYWYESPTVGYEAELEIGESGFVAKYPELWIAE